MTKHKLTGVEYCVLYFINGLFCLLLCPIYIFVIWRNLEVRRVKVVEAFGKIKREYVEPGFFGIFTPLGIREYEVSTAIETLTI